MNNLLYARLAKTNLSKNRQNILPYLLSCIGTVVMFFIMDTLAQGSGFDSMIGKDTILTVMGMGTYIIGLFAVIFLIYSNSFLAKRRKKEFGLFQILGMEKKHLAKILFFESLYLWAASLGIGILLGVLLYRMKQNAVGLANICILSTGVLMVISISTCLWTGIEEVTYTRFPHQISIEANTGVSGIMKTVEPVSQKMIEEVKTGIDQHLEEKQLRKKYESDQRYYVMLAVVDRNKVEKTQSDDAAASTLIKIMEESEYNQVTGEQVELEPGQALVFQAKQKNYGYDTIELGNQTYEVKKWNTDKKSYILDEKTQVYETMTVVTRNHEAKEAYAAVQGKEPEGYSWEYALDLIGDAGEQITVGDEIETILTESSFNGWVEVREKERNTVYSLYGSLLFLGVFVGALFLMGAVMIIYYKQVSEGFDDRKRFQIMQKVGMSRKEIRQTIQSQVVTVFFLPLAVAVVHTMVAFPLTKRIMAMLNFPDSNLFLAATAITIAAFAVVYLIVYVLTARAYYKIVE